MLKQILILIFCNLLYMGDVLAINSDQDDNRFLNFANKNSQGSGSKKSKPSISKSDAISVAKSEVKGKVLSAKLIESKGPAVYRVKLLIGDSRVRTVFVDGHSGQVIRIN